MHMPITQEPFIKLRVASYKEWEQSRSRSATSQKQDQGDGCNRKNVSLHGFFSKKGPERACTSCSPRSINVQNLSLRLVYFFGRDSNGTIQLLL